MNLSQTNMNSFAMALSYGVADLPNLVFKKELSDLETSLTNIHQTMQVKLHRTEHDLDSSDAELIVRQVITQYEELKSSPEYAEYFKPIYTLASNLGTEITGVLRTLNQVVRPEVELLKDSVVAAAAEELSDSSVTTDNTQLITMNVLDWDQYTNHYGGIENVLNSLTEFFNEPMAVSDAFFPIFDIKSPAHQWQSELTLPESGETYDDLYSRLVAVFPDELRSEAENILKGIVNISSFKELFIWPVYQAIRNNNSWMQNISVALPLFTYIDMIERMRKTPLDVTNEMMDVILHRLDLIEVCLKFAVFAFNVYRKSYLNSDAIVLNENYLNKDKLGSVDKELIEKYVYITHVTNDIPVPNSGIKMESIEPYKESTVEKFEALKVANTNNRLLLEQNSTVKAMKYVLEQYLESTDVSRLPENTHINDFVKSKLWMIDSFRNKLNVGSDNNLESILYDFVINCHFENTAVATAHKLYGVNIVNLISAGSDVDSSDLAIVDTSVASALAANFIFSELCEPYQA